MTQNRNFDVGAWRKAGGTHTFVIVWSGLARNRADAIRKARHSRQAATAGAGQASGQPAAANAATASQTRK